jgi:hypothetical protein
MITGTPMENIKKLSPKRFNAFVVWTRGPMTGDFIKELERFVHVP